MRSASQSHIWKASLHLMIHNLKCSALSETGVLSYMCSWIMQNDHLSKHIHHKRGSLRDTGLKKKGEQNQTSEGENRKCVSLNWGPHLLSEIPWCLEDRCHSKHPAFSLAWFVAGQPKSYITTPEMQSSKSRANTNLTGMFENLEEKSGKVNKSTSFPWISSVSLSFTAKQMACFLGISSYTAPRV